VVVAALSIATIAGIAKIDKLKINFFYQTACITAFQSSLLAVLAILAIASTY